MVDDGGSISRVFSFMCVCLFVDDWVYLPDEMERQEYVMNEQGVIYTGTAHYPHLVAWEFGQVSIRVLTVQCG